LTTIFNHLYGVLGPDGDELLECRMNEVAATASQRGQALLDIGRARDAETQFRQALAAEPGDAMLHALLALALLRQDRYEQARDASHSALAADPELVFAYATLAGAHAGLEQYADALGALRRGLELTPEVAGLHLQEASVLVALEQPADALLSVERARTIDPGDSDGAALHARVLYDLNRFDEADTAVHQALRLDPQNADAHRVQGLLALRRGGGRQAVHAHRTALRLDPTDDGAREGLSYAIKSRNPLYGLLLRFNLWLDSVPKAVRWGVILLPLILSRVLRPFEGQTWATVLLVVVVALALLSWTLEPVMNCVLLLSRDRHLLSRPARLATYAFLAFAGAAVACAAFSMVTGPQQLLALAFGLALWAMATGSAHHVRPRLRKPLVIAAAVAVAVAAVGVPAVIAGAGGATVAVAIVLLGGIAATWFTILA
jgi:tetratricopeptide (TPR) repeat protein